MPPPELTDWLPDSSGRSPSSPPLSLQVFAMLVRLMEHPRYRMRQFFVVGLPEVEILRHVVAQLLQRCVCVCVRVCKREREYVVVVCVCLQEEGE